jgi:AAA family ATP:ADP antiporter
MFQSAPSSPTPTPSRLDRALSLFADVRAGEGGTALLMLVNIFLLLVCYSVVKTVREPLILLGGGAEVRSYASAGQALVLIGFVPLYSAFAARVSRAKLLIGVTLFFIVGLELFTLAVTARVPYVGVAFFIWVGIFNVSLIAQFWSFANDLYSKEAGARLFPIVVIGMTAGAPLGSFIAARLFHAAFAPQVILQIAAALLTVSACIYVWINGREERRVPAPRVMESAAGGFRLVLQNRYLLLIAGLIVLLNLVNTTGEYLVARLLTTHVAELAAAQPGFNKQAYIGAFSGDYQFWVNVTAFVLQAFVTSRLVKYAGLAGALLALPLIALGGYAIISAGVGFSIVRWIKTAENATDYSIMNTARQLLWLPTSRDEKYKAKQAIDTFFMRFGDVLSAVAVYVGASVLHLGIQQFALVNTVMALVWIGVALMIVGPAAVSARPSLRLRPMVATAAGVLLFVALATTASAQTTREEELAALKAEKATHLHPYEPTRLEQRVQTFEQMEGRFLEAPLYPFIGSAMDGGGLAVGPAVRGKFGDTGSVDAHAAWSVKNYKAMNANLSLPLMAHNRLRVQVGGDYIDAPDVEFYGVGASNSGASVGYAYRARTVGVTTSFEAASSLTIGGGLDAMDTETGLLSPAYRRTRLFAEIDRRSADGYTRSGGLYRIDWSDYSQTNAGTASFQRTDADIRQFIPVFRENWIIALRALASTTSTASGQDVPFFMLPDLGGSHTLRGYQPWRFRDRNRLLFSGEYRWTAGSFVDMALFVDAGKVAPRLADLDLRGLTTSYGIGASFHTPVSTMTRIEFARTREGNSLVFSFSPSF